MLLNNTGPFDQVNPINALPQNIAFTTIGLGAAAIVLNLLTVIVVMKTPCAVGRFKYFFVVFSLFEFGYAALVCVMMPMFKVIEHRLIVFPYGSFVYKSRFARLTVGLHCSFFEIWIIFVGIMFLYRYLVLCKENWVWRIENSKLIKALLILAYLAHVAYAIFCGTTICYFKLPSQYEQQVLEEYNMDVQELPYVGVSVLTETDEFNATGAFSIANHFMLVNLSAVMIVFCGFKIWAKIVEMGKTASGSINSTRNKQVFYTISLQALNPLFLYLIPTIIMFTYTLIDSKSRLGYYIEFIPLLWVAGKVLDPLFVLLIIAEYRNTLKQVFCGFVGRKTDVSTLSSNEMGAFSETKIMTGN